MWEAAKKPADCYYMYLSRMLQVVVPVVFTTLAFYVVAVLLQHSRNLLVSKSYSSRRKL